MIFLHSHGVSTSRAVRIYKAYGDKAIETVRANPYTLAKDIHGIGFKSADTIAQKLGIARDSIMRALAGIMHALLEATGDGHCALPKEELIEQAAKLLEIDVAIVREALERLLLDGELVYEPIGGHDLIYLPYLRRAEDGIACLLRKLAGAPSCLPPIDVEKAIAWCQRKTGKELAATQREALQKALESRVLVITGGPGVGKTTLVDSILLILRAKNWRHALNDWIICVVLNGRVIPQPVFEQFKRVFWAFSLYNRHLRPVVAVRHMQSKCQVLRLF